MRTALARRLEARAAQLRDEIARALVAQGMADVVIEGDGVRLSGRGLMRRWINDLALREAGRGGR